MAGGLLLVLLVVLVALAFPLAQRADDVATVADTTTSEARSTTTTSETPSTTEPGTVVFFEDLRVGDCFDDPSLRSPEGLVGEIRRVDCASAHDGEVFALVTLPGAPGAPYPGDDETFRLGDQRCRDEFASYVGIDYLDSAWEFGYLSPSEETWRMYDDRLVICFLTDPGLDKIEGSKRDSGT